MRVCEAMGAAVSPSPLNTNIRGKCKYFLGSDGKEKKVTTGVCDQNSVENKGVRLSIWFLFLKHRSY